MEKFWKKHFILEFVCMVYDLYKSLHNEDYTSGFLDIFGLTLNTEKTTIHIVKVSIDQQSSIN